MGKKERLSNGIYETLKNLLDIQREHGTDDYNVYVYNVIESLILLDDMVLTTEWYMVYYTYLHESGEDFDYGELGDKFLEKISI